jgi:hypothetical protein
MSPSGPIGPSPACPSPRRRNTIGASLYASCSTKFEASGCTLMTHASFRLYLPGISKGMVVSTAIYVCRDDPHPLFGLQSIAGAPHCFPADI